MGWPRPAGGFFLKWDQTFISANRYFDNGGSLREMARLNSFNSSAYAELGLTDRLTLVSYLPLLLVQGGDARVYGTDQVPPPRNRMSNGGMGDLDLGLRYCLNPGRPLVVSLVATTGLPTGEDSHPAGLLTGDGELNQYLGGAAGWGLRRGWLALGTGINLRTCGFSDEWRLQLEGGYKTQSDRLFVASKLVVVQSLGNGSLPTDRLLFANNTAYVSPQLELTWILRSGLGLVYRAAGAVSARNIQAAPSHSFGLAWQGRRR
ncbi:MAG: hypothetical protein RLY31_2825 [Bacteroidota bacterium]